MLAIEWSGLENLIPALEYVTTTTLAIEWDGLSQESEGGNQICQPPMAKVKVESSKQNVSDVGMKNVENVVAENVQNVVGKNEESAQEAKIVRVKKKIWTQRKNGLYGWSYKTLKSSDSEPERVPPRPAIKQKKENSLGGMQQL